MFKVNDQITTKKLHACGGNQWIITRVGADYKIKCTTCNRELLISLEKLERIIKKQN